MRSFFLAIITLLIFCSCEKENISWSEEELNRDLLISFPKEYSGSGIFQGREGLAYEKFKNDSSSVFRYAFCRQICNSYGDSLNIDSVFFSHFTHQIENTRLDENLSLNNGGLFYYNLEKGVGKFFWKPEDVYRESLLIEYDKSLHNEVIEILESIREK